MPVDSTTAVGRQGFVERHGLWDDEQREAAAAARATVAEQGLRQIRVVTGDPHGKTRGKALLPSTFSSALTNGLDFVTALFHFDSADGIVYDPFARGGGLDLDTFTGFPDAVLVPDPRTFRVLPWAPDTGWVLGDMYLGDGTPVPFDGRHVLRRALSGLADAGFSYLAGLEVELSITRLVDPTRRIEALGGPGTPPDPPLVEALGGGYAYQAEDHLDQAHEIVGRLAELLPAVGLPLRSIEDEWGPGQFEVTFDPLVGLDAADAMVLFRGAVKQICRRLGLHATFMCRPGLPGFFASGWHLHQSLLTPDGTNAFVADDAVLSGVGRGFVAGLLEHAVEGSIFTTPTVNGYRRRKPFSLAPDRATWGIDNRAAMLRVQGDVGDPATHVENRIGEPAANSYLYLASQVAAGLDGIVRGLDPGDPEIEPYAATDRPLLPTSLADAGSALKRGEFYRHAFSDRFVDWYVGLKEFEVGRFTAAEPGGQDDPDTVTAWEHREYFTRY